MTGPGPSFGPTPRGPNDVGRDEPNHADVAAASSSSTISVPDIGLRAPIVETTDRDGYLVLPDPGRVARYVRAAPLGAARGSTVIAGHVNFADGSPAPMARLAGVAIGAFVYLTDSGGTEHRYRVVGLQTFPKSGLSPGIFSSEGPAQLVLITCDQNGPLATIDGIVQYANNTVATAVLWP